MKIELKFCTPDPEAHIGEMASICYDANTEREACIRRAAHCVDSGHLATLRFAYATVNISEISRVCSHQIVRVAHAGILQRSQRYVKETCVEYVDPPALIGVSDFNRSTWAKIQLDAEDLYLRLVDTKQMKKEDARYILPQGCSTSMNITGNFQMWKDIIGNRMTKHAQWEARDVFTEINRQLSGHAPLIFKHEAS